MKKILVFTLTTILVYSNYGQILSASTSADFQTWAADELDNDGHFFEIIHWDVTQPQSFLSQLGVALVSESYSPGHGGLTPDNLVFSPPMDLSSVSSLDISWKVAATSEISHSENYSVYLTDDLNLTNAILIFSETMTTGGVIYTRNVTSSAFSGHNNIRLVFRHHDCSYQYQLTLDDILVESGQPVSIEDEKKSLVLNAYPNPANNNLNLECNETISEVLVLNLNGQILNSQSLESKKVTIDVSNLSSGVYFYQFTTTKGEIITNRFIKN